MDIDLNKKRDKEYMNGMAFRAIRHMKEQGEATVDHFIPEDKHGLWNSLLNNVIKAVSNTAIEATGVNTVKLADVSPPATIKNIPLPEKLPTSDQVTDKSEISTSKTKESKERRV